MEKTDVKMKASLRNFFIALALLLITNTIMGMLLVSMSKKTLREQIDQRMLDVANTAAAQIDGDVIKHLTAEDKDTEEYIRTLNILRSFQDNIDLDYIYGINPGEDGKFTFAIDPDREDPAEFGESIATTDALKRAAAGTPSVDKTTHSDEWGRFYSAYSPIYDSEGTIVGIIGVDFNADWYDEKLDSHKAAVVIIIAVALMIGIVLAFLMLSQNRKRFSAMYNKLRELDNEANKLDQIIMQTSVKKLDMLPENENAVLKTLAAGEENKEKMPNEFDRLHSSIDCVYSKLHKYLKYVDSEVYTDDITGVKNKAAYKAKIKELDEQITAGEADFSVAFFDINGLKQIYTHFGYETGDELMFECAKLLKETFGRSNLYHITGDEFIVLIDKKSRFDMQDYFVKFEKALEQYNKDHIQSHVLSVAKGSATYEAGTHSDYRSVFVEAKTACDNDKAVFYGKNKTIG